jgi:hypothetical protein
MLPAQTELDESGGAVRSVQDGLLWLTVTQWARSGIRPLTFTYELDVRKEYCVQSPPGAWTRTNGISGAYDGDEVSSSTLGATIALTFDTHIITLPGATVVLTGPTGPALGTFDTLLNGVSQGLTSQAGAVAHRVALKSVIVALGDIVTFVVSIGTCTLDTFRITYVP